VSPLHAAARHGHLEVADDCGMMALEYGKSENPGRWKIIDLLMMEEI